MHDTHEVSPQPHRPDHRRRPGRPRHRRRRRDGPGDAETALLIDAGTVDVTRSNEGIESADITVAGGRTSIVSSDDGLNASGNSTTSTGNQDPRGGGEQVGPYKATISAGTLVINADGDGFDSNGTAEITGGTVVVNGPARSGNGALDVNGSFTISGGTLPAAGSSGMAVAASAAAAADTRLACHFHSTI